METPWGELPVADAHVHFFSHNFFSLLAAQRCAATTIDEVGELLGWTMPPEEPEALAAQWVAELDRHGISGAALIASLPGDEASVGAAVRAFPSRFFGYFLVNPMQPNAPAAVEAAFASGLRGLCLFPAMHRYSMHDDRAVALVEKAAARAGSVVFVHCGVLSLGVRKKLGLPSQFDLRFSNPVDLHTLALAHPKLPFVVPHFGAGYLREALMLCDLCPNVHLDTSSTNSWIRYQDAGMSLDAVFARALDVAGPKRLLFGTDSSFFPRGWHRAIFDAQVDSLRRLGADEATAHAVFHGNWERLFC